MIIKENGIFVKLEQRKIYHSADGENWVKATGYDT